jgi:hypothetical protein
MAACAADQRGLQICWAGADADKAVAVAGSAVSRSRPEVAGQVPGATAAQGAEAGAVRVVGC